MEQKADQSFIQNAVWRVQLRVGFVRIEVDDPYCRTDVVTSYGRFRAAATTASMTEVRARIRQTFAASSKSTESYLVGGAFPGGVSSHQIEGHDKRRLWESRTI
jgi:hypothetical protein